MITLYSSSMNMELNRSAVGSDLLRSQMVWGAFGLAACAVAAAVDYRRWKRAAPWILGFSVVLLVLVFVPHIGWAAKAGRSGGGAVGVLEGEWAPTRLTIIRFDNAAKARAWIESPEYRPLRDIRHKAAESSIVVVEGI